MSTLKVNAIRQTAATSDAVTLASDGTCTAKITNNLSNRNLIINGAMQVAQRGTSDTSADYFSTVDRWNYTANMTEENLTREQESLSSSDSGPYEKGFRKAWKITNGNQTGGADAGGYVIPQYHIEAQDIANSGWHYKSASSYITLSFWVKSSVAQTFYGFFRTIDGTGQAWSFNYALSANTWTKVTKKIPGNSNIDVNNDTGSGLALYLPTFMGTDRTNSGNVEETWAAYSGSNRTKPSTTTWYTTNDATWHLTGVQLEVGDVATDFEHRSYGEELERCKRYYQAAEGTYKWAWDGLYANGTGAGLSIYYTLSPEMRAAATVTHNVDDKNNVSSSTIQTSTDSVRVGCTCSSSGRTAMTRSGSGYIRLDAEI